MRRRRDPSLERPVLGRGPGRDVRRGDGERGEVGKSSFDLEAVGAVVGLPVRFGLPLASGREQPLVRVDADAASGRRGGALVTQGAGRARLPEAGEAGALSLAAQRHGLARGQVTVPASRSITKRSLPNRQVTITAAETTIEAVTRRTVLQQTILDTLDVDTRDWPKPLIH